MSRHRLSVPVPVPLGRRPGARTTTAFATRPVVRAAPERRRRPRVRIGGALAVAAALTSLLVAWPTALPGCDSPEIDAELRHAVAAIPAFAGRDVGDALVQGQGGRGHRGGGALRACHAWLRTRAGAGRLEYSIRRTPSAPRGFVVRAELFQGGWQDELREERR